MSKISIDPVEVEKLAARYKVLSQRREAHNKNLEEILELLNDVKSEVFVEEILEKLINHKEHVDKTQVQNILDSVDFLHRLADNFTEVDENSIKN